MHPPCLDLSSDINSLEMAQSNHRIQSWIVVLTASLFFFYEFIQMNLFNTIAPSLLVEFHINAAALGNLSSFYFAANVLFLLIAGTLLDRCATRRVILTALGLCIVGTVLFSIATHFAWACFFRFLTGIGSAFCFLSVMRLASRWFPVQKMALITGIIVTIAMMGGLVSQVPMTLLVQAVAWRKAMQLDALIGGIFFLMIFFIVKDYPDHHAEIHQQEQIVIQKIGYRNSLRRAFFSLHNWLSGLYVCFMNLPLGLLGGLWGVLYLTHTHPVSTLQASEISSMLFFGTLIGSPLIGFFSDFIQLRRLPMFIGSVGALISLFILLFIPTLSLFYLLVLFFLIGLFTSAQIISYPLVAENNPRILTATAVSVVSISVQGGIGVFQPFFGYLLDKHMWMRMHHITAQFSAGDFQWAMWIFPIGLILSVLIVLGLKETHCRQCKE